MDNATLLLVGVIIGALAGAVSSLVTRRVGVWEGVAVAAIFVGLGLLVMAIGDALIPVVASMFAFAVTAAIFDPKGVVR